MNTYRDDEWPEGCCFDCGLRCDSREWVDVIVPDVHWEIINPTEQEGAGLLCFHCMSVRFEEAGAVNVPFTVTSGPFAVSAKYGARRAQDNSATGNRWWPGRSTVLGENPLDSNTIKYTSRLR